MNVISLCLSLVLAVWGEDLEALRRHALESPGDAVRGKVMFESRGAIACATCHRVGGRGGEVGPDLSDIGNKFDRVHLIASVLDPGREVVEGYRPTLVALADGRMLSGLVRDESESGLTLIDGQGQRQTIALADVAERAAAEGSAMPADLVSTWEPEDFADLIAYLESLRPGQKFTPGERPDQPFSLPPGFRARVIAEGITAASALEVAKDGRVFICEQTGALRLVENDRLADAPLARFDVDTRWERGLIGVTVDPAFPDSPYIYVCTVAARPYPHHRVSRWTMEGSRLLAGSERILLEGDDQTTLGGTVSAGHQGGALHFGSDGMLYVALGEQTAGAPSQKLESLLGKILRIRADGSIPGDNPFVDLTEGKYQAVWAYGLRNPFTFAVQSETGRMFANDVGQNAWEEIDEIVRGGNYGWPGEEGIPRQSGTIAPLHVYPAASITGAAFAGRNLTWPSEYRGGYFFMDFVRGWIKVLDPERPDQPPLTFATGLRRPVDLRFAPDGSLYVLVRDAWVIDDEFQGGTGSLVKVEYFGE